MPVSAFGPTSGMTEEEIEAELAISSFQYVHSRKFWDAFSPGRNLKWSRPVRFSRQNVAKVPSKNGVYAFSIKAGNRALPLQRIVFYIGQAGGGNLSSRNTLRQRLPGYFSDERRRLRRFLDAFAGQVDFQFCILEAKPEVLVGIEQQLNDALQPPANQKDFSLNVRNARKRRLTT